MKHERSYALISLIWLSATFVLEVSTTVTIHSVGSLRDTGSVLCGSKVTFICSIPTYRYTMTWFIDSDKAAECTTTNCVQYPPYRIENIEFSTDTTNGVFNMTINPVTFKADGRVIKCEYGSYTVHVILAVKEVSTTVTIHSVGSIRDTGSVRCGSKVTFICFIPTYKYTMAWLIDSGKAAECTTTNCVQYPPYRIKNIEFSTDTTNGVFNMTINPVTFKANGRVIKCEYGSDTVHVLLAVKVFPKQSTTTISESKVDSHDMINITAMSGCVFPSSAITLQWYYYEAGETPKLYQISSPTVSVLPVCKSGTCGGDGVVQMSSTLSIPEVQTGKQYYFQIAIKHEDADSKDIVLVNSTRSYKIKKIPSKIAQATELPVIGIVVGSVVIVIIVIIVVVYAVRRNLPTLSDLGSEFFRSNILSIDTTANPMVRPIENVEEKEEGSTEIALKETRQDSENETADDLD